MTNAVKANGETTDAVDTAAVKSSKRLGRPPLSEVDETTAMSISMPTDLYKRMQAQAKGMDRSVSWVVRNYLEQGLAQSKTAGRQG